MYVVEIAFLDGQEGMIPEQDSAIYDALDDANNRSSAPIWSPK